MASIVRATSTLRKDDDDFGQPGTLNRKVVDDATKDRLISSVVGHLSAGISADPGLQRVFKYWRKIDRETGHRISKGTKGS